MSIKCLALDMDRTTLDLYGRLSPVNRRALESAIKSGVNVVIASGRSFHTLPTDVMSIKGLQYAITSNGSAVYSVPDKKCIHRLLLSPEAVENIIDIAVPYGYMIEAFIDGFAYGARDDYNASRFTSTKYAASYIRKTRIKCDDIIAFIREHKHEIESIAVIVDTPEQKESLRAEVIEKVPGIHATSSVVQMLEISHADAGKKSGLQFLMDHLGLKVDEVAAFGDGDNDIGMLRFAGTGIAMGNSTEKVLAAADKVTLHHKDDGLEYGMREFLGLNTFDSPTVLDLKAGRETVWMNHNRTEVEDIYDDENALGTDDIRNAEERLKRFAPLIMKCFPETESSGGLIESPLTPIPEMKKRLAAERGASFEGTLLLKRDSDLPVAGSVKARGGVYEVLRHAEDVAIEHGLLLPGGVGNYESLASEEARNIFSRYKIQVGSTGNLGLSIGIMSAALGFTVIVHMSSDAKQWKKDLLRSRGAIVMEYDGDYSEAVKNGRAESDADPLSYFIDDENSKDLYLGYSTAAGRLAGQLDDLGIKVDSEHPLFVYIPCGVGGAPGGVTFGLRKRYGDDVHCFFAEPVNACCMTLGMSTGLNEKISVKDIGLSGVTEADGLAVGRPSGFVGGEMKLHLSGCFTVEDRRLFDHMRRLLDSEGLFIEPSSCAAFEGLCSPGGYDDINEYIKKVGGNGTHVIWATGGSFVPDEEREKYIKMYSAEER